MARSLVVMTKRRRLLFWIVTLAVAGYLLPLGQLQLAHDLLESSIHRVSAIGEESVRQSAATPRAHDCHSCLASHPGASAFSGPEGARVADPQADRHSPPAFVNSLALRVAESPNKRSPPSGRS